MQAAASMVVDITVAATTQLVFVRRGGFVGGPIERPRRDHGDVGAIDWRGRFRGGDRRLRAGTASKHVHGARQAGSPRGPEKWLNGLAGSASAIDDAVVATTVAASPFCSPTCCASSARSPAQAKSGW